MRIVVALGGNALLKRGEPMTAEHQRANVRVAAAPLAPVAARPRARGLARQRAAGRPARPPGARPTRRSSPIRSTSSAPRREGMIGYMIEQELGNLLPFEKPLATILTMVEVDPADPAFEDPTKFVGPVYDEAEADRLAADKGWAVKPDGDKWRRVVASPAPEADLRDPADPLAARAGRRRDLRGRRRHPDDVRAGRDRDARRCRGRRRQGPRERAPGPRARRRPVRHGDRRRRRLRGLGHADQRRGSSGRRPPSSRRSTFAGGLDGPEGRGRRRVRRQRRASAPRSGRSRTSGSWSTARRARTSSAGGSAMDRAMCVRRPFGGRQASHGHRPSARPEPSAPHPRNHDELLFDDVLWVERAQWEHDQFVARMRERGVEVLTTSRTC